SAACRGGLQQAACLRAAGLEPGRQPKRNPITPATTTPVPSARCQPKPSFSTTVPSTAANSTEVSRNAATDATGARVIAHKAIAYEPIDAQPPRGGNRQLRPQCG